MLVMNKICPKACWIWELVRTHVLISSVAMVIADAFRKNAISMGSNFMKMLEIFDKIDEMEGQRVI